MLTKIFLFPVKLVIYAVFFITIGHLIVIKNRTVSDYIREVVIRTKMNEAIGKLTGQIAAQDRLDPEPGEDSISTGYSSASRMGPKIPAPVIEKITEQDQKDLQSLLNNK